MKCCSQRCRKHKPGKLDYQIGSAFVSLLGGSGLPPASTPAPKGGKGIKGDPTILVSCSTIGAAVFGGPHELENNFGRERNKVRRGIADPEEWRSIDMEDAPLTHLDEALDEQPPSYIGGAGKARPLQILSEVHGSTGGEKG